MTKLKKIHAENSYEDILKDLRELNTSPDTASSTPVAGVYSLTTLANRLRDSQIDLMINLSTTSNVKRWKENGTPEAYYLNDPLVTAKRFIQEYIRYSHLCGMREIKRAIELSPKEHTKHQTDLGLFRVLSWLNIIDTVPYEVTPPPLDRWMENFEIDDEAWMRTYFLPGYSRESLDYPVMGPILDMMLWHNAYRDYYAEHRDKKLEGFLHQKANAAWFGVFIKEGHWLIHHWREKTQDSIKIEELRALDDEDSGETNV